MNAFVSSGGGVTLQRKMAAIEIPLSDTDEVSSGNIAALMVITIKILGYRTVCRPAT